jgi:CheY-like chemotaxis protein
MIRISRTRWSWRIYRKGKVFPMLILHVDDDPDILDIARISLSVLADFELVQCGSAQEALAALQNCDPDLLLFDVMMPDMTGPELLAEIRSNTRHFRVPVIFMTAKVGASLADALRKEGALAVITKPFDPMTLGQQIDDAMKQRRS